MAADISILFDPVIHTSGLHCTSDMVISRSAQFYERRVRLEGNHIDVEAVNNRLWCNMDVTTHDSVPFPEPSFEGGILKSDRFISNIVFTRGDGAHAWLDVTIKGIYRGFTAGMDFQAEQVDIHRWRCNEAGGGDGGKDPTPENCKPNLSAIYKWESLKNGTKEEQAAYNDFRYYGADGTLIPMKKKEMTWNDNATLFLAQMIFKGIDYFIRYRPTLTISWLLAKHPKNLDPNYITGFYVGHVTQGDAQIPTLGGDKDGFNIALGGTNAMAASVLTDFKTAPFGNDILCTADNLTANADGTYVLTRCFTKYYMVEGQLYTVANPKDRKYLPIVEPGPGAKD